MEPHMWCSNKRSIWVHSNFLSALMQRWHLLKEEGGEKKKENAHGEKNNEI